MDSALKVLAVDDEPHILKLCRLNLGFEGMEVIEATDAEDAVTIAVREQPDVIVLDRMLPNTDGMTVLRELKSHAATARIPVIMLTARGLPSDRLDSWIAGASAHLTKPFSMDELTSTVKRFGAMTPQQLDEHRRDLLNRLRELA